MHTDHNLRVVARTAELTASDDPDGDDEEEAWRFGGVAVGEGDILHTDERKPVLFTADVLAETAHTQAGEPLSKNHPEDNQGNPIYPPPVEETAGTVEKAGYVPGKGLVYEAKTHDETIAKGVKAGSFDVSVHPTFDLGEQDPETGAYIPKNLEFQDLATVSKGMSPSNTAEWGPNQALASWTRDADIASEIEAHAPDGTQVGDVPGTEAEAIGWFRRLAAKAGITATDGAPDGDEEAESSAAETDTTKSMNDDEREQRIEFITANGDYDEESLEAMDDDVLETTHEVVATATADDGGDDGTDGGDDDGDSDEDPEGDAPEGDMNAVMDRLDELEEKMVTKENAGDLVEEATAKKDKAEKVEEIIAKADDYDEDDREDLMASADALIEKEHTRATAPASLPGMTGTKSQVAASAHDHDEDDLDEYGTGVQGNN